MSKTALDLTVTERQAYRLGARADQADTSERWARAWDLAQAAAGLLRQRFGATRVVAFGSLAHRDSFTPWSDVDLAAWGIEPDAFYRAVAAVTGLSSEFKVDLVAPEDCRPALLRVIVREGVTL